jgi:ATP-dependent RNA helicase RhlE
VLVATDIAARGLDIDQLPHVVNFELPNVPEDYVHRIGRTGRAGNEGEAVSLVCVDELKLLRDIERLLKREIPKVVLDGYEPDPSIKAEPIQQQRNNKGGSSGRRRDQRVEKHADSNSRSSSRNNTKGETEVRTGAKPHKHMRRKGNSTASPSHRPVRSGGSREKAALFGGGGKRG